MRLKPIKVCVVLALVAGCADHLSPPQTAAPLAAASNEPWEAYWRAHGVSPAPPPGFLESSDPVPEIVNLTRGALDDETVRRWVMADLRRGRGDAWSFCHLRLDVANADVFGPPGLNGTGEAISAQLGKGVVEIDCGVSSTTEAVGVVSVPKFVHSDAQNGSLTDFVIVIRRRSTGAGSQQIFQDGHRVAMPKRRPAGTLTWQLDAGELREDPIVGPLWYQAHGWSCGINGWSDLDLICRLLAPGGRDDHHPSVPPIRAAREPADVVIAPT